MTEEALSQLAFEDKLKVTRYLIADFAAQILSDDPAVAGQARHNLMSIAMAFSNLQQLVTAAGPDDLAVIRSIYKHYRYQPEDAAAPSEGQP